MNRIAWTLVVALFISGAALAAPTFLVNIEEGAEMETLDLHLGNDGNAMVATRICDECRLITLSVTPATRAFRKNKEITLTEAAGLRGEGATLLFDPETLIVNRIVFWQ